MLADATRGQPAFPVRPGSKEPLTPRGFHDATTDSDTIRRWWARWPDANIGLPTGSATVDVLDVDVRPDGDGWEALERLKRAGLLAGAVRLVRTPSGGLHVYFPGTEQTCSTLPGKHLDFKASGGYVLIPPSYVHTDQYAARYVELDRREHGQPLDWQAVHRVLVAPQPPRPIARAGSGRMGGLVRHVQRQQKGNRNNALYWAARCAVEEGNASQLGLLVDAAVHAGLPEWAARGTAASAYRAAGGAA